MGSQALMTADAIFSAVHYLWIFLMKLRFLVGIAGQSISDTLPKLFGIIKISFGK